MKIALIGASGFVGSAILKEALQRGHQVTGLGRNPEKVNSRDDEKVSAQEADVMNTGALSRLLEGHDIVVSA